MSHRLFIILVMTELCADSTGPRRCNQRHHGASHQAIAFCHCQQGKM